MKMNLELSYKQKKILKWRKVAKTLKTALGSLRVSSSKAVLVIIMQKQSRVGSMARVRLGRLRLAAIEDAPDIMAMVNESMSRTFRVHSTAQIVYLIDNCVLAICQLDHDGDIIGFLALRDYPVMPSVHPNAWEEYIWTKYKSVEMNSRNTLFIHLVCWNAQFVREVIDNMLKSVFMHDPYVHHIAFIKTDVSFPLLVPGQSRAEGSFRRVSTLEKGMSAEQLPGLFVADRSEVSPRLRIRRAVEEDNDDIVPILEAHSSRLCELYGEYYISELVARHPDSERVLLVCEHNELAVGVMCLNTDINFEALEESFELSPFSGLKKLDTKPTKRSKDVDSLCTVNSAYTEQTVGSSVLDPLVRGNRVTWIFDEDEFQSTQAKQPSPVHTWPVSYPSQLDILHLLEEDEEVEFDIVNIDTDLMRVPKLLSYGSFAEGPVEVVNKIIEGSHKEVDHEDLSKKRSKGSVSKIPTGHKIPEPARYSGKPNAFLIELFAMHHDYDERYGFDMLEVAFEVFPDREYCMICLPSNSVSMPLLEHFTLVTPFSSRMRFINDTLYVAHINSVRGNLRVRPGEAYDKSGICDICEHAPLAQALVDLFESALVSVSLECYVMLSQNQPIGMIVIGPLDDSSTIRTQYELEAEPRRPGTDGMILSSIVSPVFEPHFRWFMRELLRNSKYTTLFWISRMFSKGENNPLRHLISVAGHMTPVHPRQSIPNISGNKDLDKIFKDLSVPFALWVLERPLTSLSKPYVNSNIVVIGASCTGLAFLETLFLGPTCEYLSFSNVTLVSEHGLPTVSECLKAAVTCIPRTGRYTDRYLKSIPFYFYLDIMTAVMVGIDRKKKCIYLKGGGVKYYDELVLTLGRQFQHPDYLHVPLQLVKEVEQGKPCERILMDNPKFHPDSVAPQILDLPENVFLINSLFEANINLRILLHMINQSGKAECEILPLSVNNPIIVYGDCIEAYSCMAALLELGIAPENIGFVEPFPPDDPAKLRVNCFNNETVDARVQDTIESLDIRVHRRYYLTGWQHNNNHVESINLMSQLHYVTLPCFALFYFGLKAINVHAFKAINECGLVYDGGLVVDTNFETNDPNVYGAGPCVKYSRKLYATQHAHQYYCAEDVGEALAHMFLKKLDPFMMGNDTDPADLMPRYSSAVNTSSRGSVTSISSAVWLADRATRMHAKWHPVMKFLSPIIKSATLPGPLYYVNIRKPGIEIPMEVQQCLPRQGHTLLTDKNDNYFRLQLDVLHCVNAVTCLSKKKFSCDILTQLYGKHEAFFNKLLAKYQMKLIPDLYEFFVQPWLSALYQETFADLLRDINEQDIGTANDLMKGKYKTIHEDDKTLTEIFKRNSDGGRPLINFAGDGPSYETKKQANFHSVLDRFVARNSFNTAISPNTKEEFPSECGQSAEVRQEAVNFWKSMNGENTVTSHLDRYLEKNSVTNSHYATPDPQVVRH